jgi:hypothetical protein
VIPLKVPGLEAERHVVRLRPQQAGPTEGG